MQAAVAPLLPEHPGAHLRGGQQRPGEDTGGAGGAPEDGQYPRLVKMLQDISKIKI